MKEHGTATTLCYVALCLLSAVTENQGTKLLESLQCYNDFESYVSCTWTENQLSRRFVNMSLYLLNDDKKTLCEPTTQFNLTKTCYSPRTNNYFTFGLIEKYTFLPDRNLEAQLYFSNKEIMQEEQCRSILYFDETRYFLHWSTESFHFTTENQTHEISQCEVNYKRELEDWESSSPGECSTTWGVIKRDLLETGVLYVARMRVKYNEEIWSNWSSEILLESRNTADEAKPQNLRVFFAGAQLLTCVWELRLEVTDLVSFSLFYKQDVTGNERKYQPTCQQEVSSIPYISCHCSVTLEDINSAESHISVRPNEESRNFRTCLYIKLPPGNLTIEETVKGQEYTARWNINGKQQNPNWRAYYEVCYWRENDFPNNERSPDCPYVLIKKSPDESPEVVLTMSEHLKPDSTYHMKIRMHFSENDPSLCVSGPWSEWSPIQTWKTEAVVDQTALYISVPICLIIFIIGYKVLCWHKKKWEDMIPDPKKSNLIMEFQQTKDKSDFGLKDLNYFIYEEMTDHCKCVYILNDPKNSKQHEVDLGSKQSTQIYHCGSYWNSQDGIEGEEDYSRELTLNVSGYQPFSDMLDDQENKDSVDIQYTPTAFDGPYLLCDYN